MTIVRARLVQGGPRGIAAYSVALADVAERVIDMGEFPVVLGGDCSIMLGCLLALRRHGRHGHQCLLSARSRHWVASLAPGVVVDTRSGLLCGFGFAQTPFPRLCE